MLEQYNPKEIEAKWMQKWLENGYFDTKITDAEKFSIALPPPNVTGELHMGHALGGTIQDILIRYNRMLGKDVLWQIGTDHAGIGTQLVVEKFLKKTEKKSKEDLGRDEFINRVKIWKEEYGNKIIEQMKVLGFSPDYKRIRYTMDDHYVLAVQSAFVKYFNDGLIYRGNRVVNWCPKCLTSLSDLEIQKEEAKKKLYRIKYKFVPGSRLSAPGYIVVATTRPETMFGDVAVAINPDDTRYKDLVEELKKNPSSIKVLIPLSNKEIPVILDEHVKLDFGTGALKVTPAHDANDYEISLRHGLEPVIIMDDHARMKACDEIPESLNLTGLDRYIAREKVLEMLGSEIEAEEYIQEKDLHDRCATEIEPYLSEQWYLNMKGLAKQSLKLVEDAKSKFIPERYTGIYKNWLGNIQDWCISRQIWWGHRIPVFYYEENGETKYYAALEAKDPSHRQDNDVLDTWFSSALWPFETLKSAQGELSTNDWDKQVFEAFYPTSVLATAREIINLWVTRMIFSSIYFENSQQPFSDILIHPVVQTPDGKRMSKSKGNAIDPLEMVSKYGADASRLWYASVGIHGQQDVKFPGRKDAKEGWLSDTFEQYRKFCNKLFNATKFVLTKLEESEFRPKALSDWDLTKASEVDKWILTRYDHVLKEINLAFAKYDFTEVQKLIYEFLWFDFCDWYIEFSKIPQTDKEIQRQILFYILESSLRVLHPIAPFITEELWQVLKAKYSLKPESVCFAEYPQAQGFNFDESESVVEEVKELITALRNFRQSLDISWSTNFDLFLTTKDEKLKSKIKDFSEHLKNSLKLKSIEFNEYKSSHEAVYKSLMGKFETQVPLAGIVDIDKVTEKIKKQIEKLDKDISVLNSRLSSDGFAKNASLEKINEVKQSLEELFEKKKIYQSELAMFK